MRYPGVTSMMVQLSHESKMQIRAYCQEMRAKKEEACGVNCGMSNEDMRDRSGNVTIKCKLTSFLYDLMRDHLAVGEIEELIQDSTPDEVTYTNGWLAQYAHDLARRLLNELPEKSSIPDPNLAAPDKREEKPAPEGEYGVFCEPLGHKGDPCWTSSPKCTYEEAIKEADFMNRANHAWHYYAKPIR